MNLDDDYTKQIFELYKEKGSLFSKVFFTLVLFSVVFFIAIVVPFSTLRSKRWIDGRLNSIEEQISEVRNHINLYQRPQEGIKRLRERIQQGPGELREFIEAITSSPPLVAIPTYKEPSLTCVAKVGAKAPDRLGGLSGVANVETQELMHSSLCKDLLRQDGINCEARYYVLFQLCEYEEFIDEHVIEPLTELRDENIPLFEKDELQSKFQEVTSSIENKLDENPTFWYTVEGKIGFATAIDEEIEGFSNFILGKLEEPQKKLRMRLEEIQKEASGLESDKSILEKRKTEIVRRLREITSPIGKLPFSIAESVFMFPILLAAGFIVCAVMLLELVRLRRMFLELYRKKDPEGSFLTPKRVALITPLWIDSELDSKVLALRWFILLVPFLLAVITFAIGLSCYGAIGSDIVLEQGQIKLYQALDIMALLIFVYSYWKIYRAVQQNVLTKQERKK